MLRQIVVAKEPLIHLSEQEKNELKDICSEYLKLVNQYIAIAAKIPDLSYSGYHWQKLPNTQIPTRLPRRWQLVAWKQAVLHVLYWQRQQKQNHAAGIPPITEPLLPANSDVVRLYRGDDIADVYLQVVGIARHRPLWQPIVFSPASRQAIAAYGDLSRIVYLKFDEQTDTWLALFMIWRARALPETSIAKQPIPADISAFLPANLKPAPRKIYLRYHAANISLSTKPTSPIIAQDNAPTNNNIQFTMQLTNDNVLSLDIRLIIPEPSQNALQQLQQFLIELLQKLTSSSHQKKLTIAHSPVLTSQTNNNQTQPIIVTSNKKD